MERSEQNFQNEYGADQKVREELHRLQDVADILSVAGLQVIDRFITSDKLYDSTAEMGFPIVMDGAQGIRASYSKRDGLKIWFTNGFEDPNNPKRQEVERKLKEAKLL